MFIESFSIKGLFGYKDVDLRFNNRILILIAENGYGKTTILNALNYTIQGCYKELLSIKFKSISITIEGTVFGFDYSQLLEYYEYLRHNRDNHSIIPYLKEHLDPAEFDQLCHFESLGKSNISRVTNRILRGIPDDYLYGQLKTYLNRTSRFSVFESLKKTIQELDYTILFNPTYRRVEADLNATFRENGRVVFRPVIEEVDDFYDDDDDEEDGQSTEYAATVIRFGMKDVQRMITSVTDSIKESSLNGFAKVSSDMIRHLLDEKSSSSGSLNPSLDISSLKIILGRTGDYLSEDEKEKFIEQIETKTNKHNPYLTYFLEQLYSVYQNQEHIDRAIKGFRDVCNGYLYEKQFVYDESRVELKLYRTIKNVPDFKEDNVVDLNNLSSGEKQIVSLFAQIYLNVDKQYVMLLDEPELSLSIFWQERLLSDIYNSGRCALLLVTTHSPFIFNNEMKDYVVGLQEFQKNKNDYE